MEPTPETNVHCDFVFTFDPPIRGKLFPRILNTILIVSAHLATNSTHQHNPQLTNQEWTMANSVVTICHEVDSRTHCCSRVHVKVPGEKGGIVIADSFFFLN